MAQQKYSRLMKDHPLGTLHRALLNLKLPARYEMMRVGPTFTDIEKVLLVCYLNIWYSDGRYYWHGTGHEPQWSSSPLDVIRAVLKEQQHHKAIKNGLDQRMKAKMAPLQKLTKTTKQKRLERIGVKR